MRGLACASALPPLPHRAVRGRFHGQRRRDRRDGGPLARLVTQPPFFLFGGVLLAFYLLSITWIAPRFGLGDAILCVLMGQMVSAAAIDHRGLLSGLPRPISTMRATAFWS